MKKNIDDMTNNKIILKKLFLFLIVALSTFNVVLAQSAFEDEMMIKEGLKLSFGGFGWATDPKRPTSYIQQYFFENPTVIDGYECLELNETTIFTEGVEGTYSSKLGYIRTEGMKVYAAPLPISEPVKWYLMYDFGIKPGEWVEFWCPFVSNPYSSDRLYLLDEEESPEFGGRKLMHLVSDPDYPELDNVTWIKGITNKCWFEMPIMCPGILASGGCFLLYEIRLNDQILFADFPTEVDEIGVSDSYEIVGQNLVIKHLSDCEPVCVYDLEGNIVYCSSIGGHCDSISLPHKGLYIVKVGNQINKIMVN